MDSIQRDAGLEGIYVAGAELTKFEIGGDDGTLAIAAHPAILATHLHLSQVAFLHRPTIPGVCSGKFGTRNVSDRLS
jgi:hypothetical protein